MNTEKPLVVIAGLGRGLGEALATFFVQKEWCVVGLNRRLHSSDINGADLFQVDISDEQQMQSLSTDIMARYGVPTLLIHNTQILIIEHFEQTSANQFEQAWRGMALSAFVFAQSFLPMMATLERGAMIVSGATASIRGGARFSAFSSAKFALRGLTQSLARTYHSQGVHIVHVLLDGIIDTESSRHLHQLEQEQMIRPGDIATLYWQLYLQPKSAWSHEIDLRPASEVF